MGIPPLPLIPFDFDDETCVKVQKQRLSSVLKRQSRCSSMRRRPRSILMMKRRGRGLNPFQRKVKALKKLIPNKESVVGLDGLFKETADYIMCLQMRVKVMQVMVKVLTTGSNDQ